MAGTIRTWWCNEDRAFRGVQQAHRCAPKEQPVDHVLAMAAQRDDIGVSFTYRLEKRLENAPQLHLGRDRDAGSGKLREQPHEALFHTHGVGTLPRFIAQRLAIQSPANMDEMQSAAFAKQLQRFARRAYARRPEIHRDDDRLRGAFRIRIHRHDWDTGPTAHAR